MMTRNSNNMKFQNLMNIKLKKMRGNQNDNSRSLRHRTPKPMPFTAGNSIDSDRYNPHDTFLMQEAQQKQNLLKLKEFNEIKMAKK